MKFIVPKQTFVQGLQMVQSVISSHPPNPVLYNVAIHAEEGKLHLMATDTNMTMRCTLAADVKKAGGTTVHARRLFNVVRELPEEDIEYSMDEKDGRNVSSLECGASSFKLYGIAEDEFPPLPAVDAVHSYPADQAVLKDMLRKTAYAASDDESRQILNGVFMSFQERKLTVVATDGRRLALVEQELESSTGQPVDMVVPTKTINELLRALKDEGQVKVMASPKIAAFDMGDTLIVSKLVDGTYPNYRQVIPSQCEQRIMLDREVLLGATRRASVISDMGLSVKLTFQKNKLQIVAVAPDVGEDTETIPIKYTGGEIAMAFNPAYLMDPLRNLTSDTVFFEVSDSLSPSVIKCDIPFLYVIMPLRVS